MQAGGVRRPGGGENEEARPIETTAQTRVGKGRARRPSREREKRGEPRPRAGEGDRPGAALNPPVPRRPETTFSAPLSPL